MTDETEALPSAEAPEATAGAGEQQTAAPADAQQDAQTEAQQEKPEADPRDKELRKAQRRINNIVSQREQARAEAAQLRAEIDRLRGASNLQNDRQDATIEEDADVLKIPRAELPKVLEKLQSEAAQRGELKQAAAKMAKALGDDFQAVTDELAEVFSADLQFAVAASEAPAELARYLTDPDNADEAERISRMSPLMAGRALARIEAKLTAQPDKPQPSKAPKPIEPTRGAGAAVSAAPSNMEQYMAWANKQYARR